MGCGTCVSVCPKSAISLKIVPPGVYIPSVVTSLCINRKGCDVCNTVCPGRSVMIEGTGNELFPDETRDYLLGHIRQCFTAYAKDYNVRFHSAAGGAVTQMLIFMIENNMIDGALVTRMKKNAPLEPEVFIATNREEIIEASSSKYCPVSLNANLRDIINANGRFAIVGLPCHIHGIRKAAAYNSKLKEKIFIHMGLFCSSNRTFWATEYLLKRYAIKKENIKKFAYRDEGWLGSMVINLFDGQRMKYSYREYYPELRSFFIPQRCTFCIDHTAELADISFGDIYIPEFWSDTVGTTAIIARNHKAQDIVFQACEKGYLHADLIDKQLIVKSQRNMLNRKKYHTEMRFKLFQALNKSCPIYDISYPPISSRQKVRHLLSALILYSEIGIGKKRALWFLIKHLHYLTKKIKREH